MFLRRVIRLGVLFFILIAVLAPSITQPKPAEAQGIGLRIALDDDPVTLDPAQVFTRPSQFVFNQLYEGLFQYAEDGLIIPAGATGYDVSGDGLIYTINLRQDASWSDDNPVTAQHYVDGLLQLSGWEYEFLIQDIETIEASDTYEITITLYQASAYFPHILAIPQVSSPVRLDKNPAERPFVNNGPYKLDEWVDDDHLSLTKNDYYWGKSGVQIEEILFLVVPDRGIQLLMYESDELDVSGFPTSAITLIEGDPILNSQFHHVPRPGTYFLGLNTQLTPTDNYLFRMALASSIDRQWIIDNILQLPWRTTATGMIPPEVPGYQGIDVGYPFIPSLAQTYFNDSGVVSPAVLLWYNDSPLNEAIAQEVANMWNVLGVNVTLQEWDWDTYLNELNTCSLDSSSCPYQAYRLGWVGDYLDARNFLYDTLDRGFGATGWASTGYVDLLDAAAAEEDQAARTALYRQADRLLVQDDAVIIPIFHYDESYLIKPHIIFEFPLSGFAPRIADWSIFPIEVTNTNDTGSGSLRQAILDANAIPGKDVIAFNIPASDQGCNVGGVCTIQPQLPLPSITDPVFIDGYSQPGASPNTNGPGLGNNAVLKIELDGSQAGASSGLIIFAGASTVQGLVINRFGIDGIRLYGNGGNIIRGNHIGTDITGSVDLGNSFRGVFILDVPNNMIGGVTAGDSNIISGNSNNGIEISGNSATGNLVQGNFIGTDANGTLNLGNSQRGVLINEAPNNIVGGSTEGARNVISANTLDGIYIHGSGAFGNEVRGNYIGTDLNGTTALGNSNNGVFISVGASSNTIGGPIAGAGNVISGNVAGGILITGIGTAQNVVQGNFIGTDSTGTAALGNGRAGVLILNSPNNWIGGDSPGEGNVISANAVEGVYIAGTDSTGNMVQGNLIGTDATGMAALGNAHGLIIDQSASNNTIGGTTTGAGNVISASTFSGIGINPGSTGNFVQGNFIGTDFTGTNALGNVEHGVFLEASSNTIGGTDTGAGNVISSNGLTGIMVNVGTTGTIIQGNFIGTDVTGTMDLGNTLDGVGIVGSTGNTIGGIDPRARNVISGNGDNGVALNNSANDNTLRGNIIGADISGLLPLGNDGNGVWVYDSSGSEITLNHVAHNLGNGVQIEGSLAIGNTISLNSIHDNAYEGIVNLTGGNEELEPPTITSMLGDHVEGTAPSGSRIEVFADTAGEGGTYLGEAVADPEGTFEYYSPLAGPNLTATATDGAGNTSEFSQAVQWVPDNCEINDSYDYACDVATKLGFFMPSGGTFSSYVSGPDDVDWFYFDLSGSVTPGDQITISLSGLDETALPANYDLVVLAELTVDPATNATPLQGVPLQGVPLQGVPLQGVPLQGVPLQGVPLQGVPLQGVETESIPLQGVPLQGVPLQGVPLQGVPLQGVPLQGVPLQGVPLQGVGFHQGTAPEVVSTLYRGGMTGKFYVLVWSSTGEFGITPEASQYEVKVVPHPVVVDACTTGLDRGLLGGSLQGPLSESEEPRTLILVHRPRMVALYGLGSTNDLLATLESDLISHPLVDGVIVDLGDPSFYVGGDAAQALEDAYVDWDQFGCQAETANLVTLEIKKTILQILDQLESIENIVIVGADKIIPHRRVPDGVVRTEEVVPNEFDYQFQSAEDGYKMGNIAVRNNPLHATLRLQYYLSDDFYADLTPILLQQGYELSVPHLPIGRLVETPEDMIAYIDTFLAQGGLMGDEGVSISSISTGYEFLDDQAAAIHEVFNEKEFTPNPALPEGWDTEAFLAAYKPPQSDVLDVASLNAHFDHWRMATADGSIITSTDLGPLASESQARLIFSVGCHAGFNFPDEEPISSNEDGRIDHAQALIASGATLIGNWGFGYGDDAALAYSEELMLNFARYLGNGTLGQALTQAKREYILNQAVLDPVHEKVLMEAIYYGLPMWQLTADITEIPEGIVILSTTDIQQHELDIREYVLDVNTGYMQLVDILGQGSYYALSGQTQAALFRPIQPKGSIDISGVPNQVAHGVLFTAGMYYDVPNFDPILTMPVWTQSVPELHFIFEGWDPARFWSLAQLERADGSFDEKLVIVPGQFNVDEDETILTDETVGTERIYESLNFEIFYGPATSEFQPPTIGLVQARLGDNQSVLIKVEVEDPQDALGQSSGIVRVIVTYTPEFGGGAWQSKDLALNPSSGKWERIVAITGPIDFFVQAVDGSGNVGMFAGNGYFTPSELVIVGPSTILVGQPVSFSANHLLEDPAVLWEFGDGALGEGADAIEHIFTEPGDLAVTVRVVDPDGNIGETSFQVVVIDDPSYLDDPLFWSLNDLRDYFADPDRLPDDAIDGKAENRRKTLLNKISAVLALIGSDELEDAVNKLQNDLRSKMDGCPPEADNNDWIINCSHQYELRARIDNIVALLESYQTGE